MAKARKTVRPQVGLRVSEEVRQRLEDAATRNGRSINSEIVSRLDHSFETEDRLGGPGLVQLVEAIAVVMKTAGEEAFAHETGQVAPHGAWRASPYAYNQAVIAAREVLKRRAPPGKVKTPGRSIWPREAMGDLSDKEVQELQRKLYADIGLMVANQELKKKDKGNE